MRVPLYGPICNECRENKPVSTLDDVIFVDGNHRRFKAKLCDRCGLGIAKSRAESEMRAMNWMKSAKARKIVQDYQYKLSKSNFEV